MSEIRVYQAKKIITMDPGRPEASAVAVRDGRIVSVGTMETIKPWLERYPHVVDDTFADKIIMPGLIDPHTHLHWSACVVNLNYIGPIDSPTWLEPAVKGREAVFERLREIDRSMEDPNQTLFAWGFDPAFHGGQIDRDILDGISKTRPIWVLSYAIHYLYVNSAMLDQLGATDEMQMHGLGRFEDGRLNGQFIEFEATRFAMEPFRREMLNPQRAREGMRKLAATAKRAGITLTADMGTGVTNFDDELRDHRQVVLDDDFPLRMVLTPSEFGLRAIHGEATPDFIAGLAPAHFHEKLRFHGVKFWTDGSYQAMSLRLKFPGYLDGGNGLRGQDAWEELADRMMPYWERGIQLHVHANGDEAVDATLDALAELQRRLPRFDHRFTIEHYLISTTQQARRLKALGGAASVLIYYLHTRSQLQSAQGLGPDRAEATARVGTLEREGVPFAFHSDHAFAVAPLHPLTAAWIAMTRIVQDGKTVFAPHERIERDAALRAITIDAAYILRMENEVGSIEVGKLADFAILEEDPLEVEVDRIRHIPIWGTVLGGLKQPA
ncbi:MULTISPECIES: amidohydrolase [unclassified Mesorhizobium]|uniref:amidohydrolase n=1 Tax=unclassified Mesorhizobium TaxID=325217 RepID=UPI00241595A5|nr:MULTISPECIES: amidohydrolase [unclassified Mesorhizobium]MDG4890065.1 amidohydrolase [Mesorhizobium sp. WSM4887]MDG4904207.1 amidohydrolase [Mesorhizobium sp. WSM4962]MDG4909234.1 amidohydrolase [Mesorhizobium sp. WSM4898]MDG4921858.1 amidohydrolase [Mesorhizobium sp. WSM4989]